MNSYKKINYEEYGSADLPTVILLHGTLLGPWQYDDVCAILKDHYHIIVPVIDGHAHSGSAFESITDSAIRLLDFIQDVYHGHIALIGGMSLGGQIVLEMLAIKRDFCDYALIESTSAWAKKLSIRKFTPLSLMNFKPAHLSRKQLRQYGLDFSEIDKHDLEAIVRATENYEVSPAVRNISTKVFIEVGSFERGLIGESEDLHHLIDHSQMMLMHRYKYGDFSLRHVDSYANMVEKLLHRRV